MQAPTVARPRRRRLAIAPKTAVLVVAAGLQGIVALPPDSLAPADAAPSVSTYCDTTSTAADVPDGPDDNGGGTATSITVHAEDVETHEPLAQFSYLVNLDNTAHPTDPDPLRHPSLHQMPSHSPIVGAGDQTHPTFTVPDGCRYLVSVRAPGYKLWGQHVELLPGPASPTALDVTIELLADAQGPLSGDDTPLPYIGEGTPGDGLLDTPRAGLPLSDLVVKVFHDFHPTNGQPDPTIEIQQEPGDPATDMSGFHIVVKDTIGEVVVDFGGSPLCQDIGHDCITDAGGNLTISGLPFGKYEVFAIAPDGSSWVQTTTFEGTQAVDAWLEEGSDGRGAVNEFLVEPFVNTAFWFGFVQPRNLPTAPAAETGTITGRAVNYLVTPPLETSVPQPNEPVARPWVALNDIGANDELVALVRGDANGNFTIPNVPPSTYQLAIWDTPLDYIMGFHTVHVPVDNDGNPANGEIVPDVAMGELGIFRWFGWLSGFVYLDNGLAGDGTPITASNSIVQHDTGAGETFAANGLRDCYDPNPGDGIRPSPMDFPRCERGLPAEEVLLKFRDGTIKSATVTNNNGYYEFPEARGPLGRYLVAEVGFARRQRTGHSLHQEFNFDPASPPNPPWDPYVSTRVPGDLGGELLLSSLIVEGHRSWVDWGKRNYDTTQPGENGGIAGAVLYGTTRNEFDPSLAAQEDYEPGIPDVPLRIWSVSSTPRNQGDDVLLAEITSDRWVHPGGPDNPCSVLDNLGRPLPPNVTNNLAINRCLEVPLNGNETQDGAWDGGFAFEEDCSAAIADQLGGPATRASYGDAPASEIYDEEVLDLEAFPCVPLASPADYIVEVLVPAHYQLLKEEDQNTDEGVSIVPQLPPPPCVGDLHVVNDPRNPAHGQPKPLCDRKLVTVARGQNAAAEFALFTECESCDVENAETAQRWDTQESVPLPGRFLGLMEDDINVNEDPNSIAYGEKVGLANVPIGIYDFTGRHLTTITTDENGYYEVLLPSSYTALCPIPSGVCPGMYVLILNDPGSLDAPNETFRLNYLTEPIVFDVWPGKMTPTDTPVDPISTLVCQVTVETPEVLEVSEVWTRQGARLSLRITGTGFENGLASPPTVTLAPETFGPVAPIPLAVTSFVPSDNTINPRRFEDVVTVTVPNTLAVGRYQLAVTADGLTTRNGITFHVRPAATPNVVTVLPTTGELTSTPIQDAIDSASAGALIDVRPGTYRENVIMHKAVVVQGHGPGGIIGDPRHEPGDDAIAPANDPPFSHIVGSVIDARFYLGSAQVQTAWAATLTGPASPYGGPPAVPEGAGITVVAGGSGNASEFDGQTPRIDGFGFTAARGFGGGAVYVHAYGRNLRISNNIFDSNAGVYGGAIALGLPLEGGGGDAQNDRIRMDHNRILQNGGSFLAGGVGIFPGADNYQFDHNDVCGNYSLEYGGGVSHFGRSPGGRINDNHVYYNDAFDEGGGIQIAGDVQPGGTGSGNVIIERNTVEYNLSNDDGGGIRLLRPLHDRVDIRNNFVNNNVATDFGGGIALDDASNVFIINNTIALNASTATAEDADRTSCNPGPVQITCPHAAGLAVEPHSTTFTPPDGSTFSDPVMFNDIFWQNEAFFWSFIPAEPGEPDSAPKLGLVGGCAADEIPAGGPGCIDMEVVFGDPGDCLDPRVSILTDPYGPDSGSCTTPHASNLVGVDPSFAAPLQTTIKAAPFRLDLNFIEVTIFRGQDGPMGTIGTFFVDTSDYHIRPESPAVDDGVATDPFGLVPTQPAPSNDADLQPRPQGAAFDIGADEIPSNIQPETLYVSRDCGATSTLFCPTDVDIFAFDGDNTLELRFDGSDVMPAFVAFVVNLDAFEFRSPSEILVSFDLPIPRAGFAGLTGGATVVDDSDVLLFTASSLGANTTGTWSWYFDGSDVSLTTDDEDIDGLELLPDGKLLMSTIGSGNVPNLTFRDEDVIAFTPAANSTPTTTIGASSMFFHGTGVGLAGPGIDADAVAITDFNDDVFLSFDAFVNVPALGINTQDEDIVECQAFELGLPTECEFDFFFDGSGFGQGPFDIDGIDLTN